MSVLLEEVLALLQVNPNRCYIDGTLGLGGHAQAILEKSSPEGRLLGIDRDLDALSLARSRLEPYVSRVTFRHGTFDHVRDYLSEMGISEVDGMCLDLGISSLQVDEAARGFSFSKDGPLDMRMNSEQEWMAADLIRESSEIDLERIFRDYGEERYARGMARKIVFARKRQDFTTTGALRDFIARELPGRRGKIHPATRIFQGLRIAVNQELEILEKFLKQAPNFLRVGGVLAIISFHSLEDRIVKHAFRRFEASGFKILTKKPLTPQPKELRFNPRSRSAKLRAIQRIE